MMPPYTATIDRAVWDAPEMLQAVAVARYFLTGADVQSRRTRRAGKLPKRITDEERARVLGCGRGEYNRRVDMLVSWVGARMNRRTRRAA